MTLTVIAGLAVFVVTYALIATERIHKTIAAMAGGVAMVLLGIVSQEQAFAEIDFNVIFLLAGMMILAGDHPEDRRLRVDGGARRAPRRRRSVSRPGRAERDHRGRQRASSTT